MREVHPYPAVWRHLRTAYKKITTVPAQYFRLYVLPLRSTRHDPSTPEKVWLPL